MRTSYKHAADLSPLEKTANTCFSLSVTAVRKCILSKCPAKDSTK